MNKHIAKLREQLVRDMDRLTVELAEVANAINAIDGMSAAREGARDKRPSSVWTPERRHALSEKAKAKVAANPEHYQELARKMHAARRANGASGHAEASA